MTRHDVEQLQPGDIIKFTCAEDSSIIEYWTVKDILHDNTGAVRHVLANNCTGWPPVRINIHYAPEYWTLIKCTLSDVHPLEQLQQRLGNNK